MAFHQFSYPDVLGDLGLTETSVADLFAGTPPVAPGPGLTANLPAAINLATTGHTEAARSTWIVGGVLLDLWDRYGGRINLSAGATFAADPDAGLNGLCDFIIGRSPQVPRVVAPVCVIFEAKKDSVPDGFGQTIAGMVGVQRFNRRAGREIDPVYGCSTNGTNWRFLALSGTTVTLDQAEYAITHVDRILGILTHIVGPVPARSAA